MRPHYRGGGPDEGDDLSWRELTAVLATAATFWTGTIGGILYTATRGGANEDWDLFRTKDIAKYFR